MRHQSHLTFTGEIVRRDSDGFGMVKFTSPDKLQSRYGFFTIETIGRQALTLKCGQTLVGTAEPFGETYKLFDVKEKTPV